jgi:hypothetical protein
MNNTTTLKSLALVPNAACIPVDLEDLQRELFLLISAWTNAEEEVIIFIFSYKRTRVNVKKK